MVIGSNNLFGGWRGSIPPQTETYDPHHHQRKDVKHNEIMYNQFSQDMELSGTSKPKPIWDTDYANLDYRSRLIDIQSDNITLRKSNDDLQIKVLELERELKEKTKILEIILEKDRRNDNALREQQEYVLDSLFDYVDMQTEKLENRGITTYEIDDVEYCQKLDDDTGT